MAQADDAVPGPGPPRPAAARSAHRWSRAQSSSRSSPPWRAWTRPGCSRRSAGGLPLMGYGGVYHWAPLLVGLPVLLAGTAVPVCAVARSPERAGWVFVTAWIAVVGAGASRPPRPASWRHSRCWGRTVGLGRVAVRAQDQRVRGDQVHHRRPAGRGRRGARVPARAQGRRRDREAERRTPAGKATARSSPTVASVTVMVVGDRPCRGGTRVALVARRAGRLRVRRVPGRADRRQRRARLPRGDGRVPDGVRGRRPDGAATAARPGPLPVAVTVWLASTVAGLVLGVVGAAVAAMPPSDRLPDAGPDIWWVAPR